MDKNSFLVLYYEDGVQRCGILKPVPEEEITTKEIVVVAALNPGQIRSEIIAFNRQSEKYRVVLEDYSVYGDTAAQLLNAAMASKNAPDILLIGDSQELRKYGREKAVCRSVPIHGFRQER